MHRLIVLTLVLTLASLGATAAQASPITYVAVLSGPAQDPPNSSAATGFVSVVFDLALHTMVVNVSFSDLMGNTTVSHIHAPTELARLGNASVATQTPSFIGFPVGVQSGNFSSTFDMTLASSYRAGYLAGFGGSTALAEAALAQAAADGKAYFNIHTTAFPGGEIRGFLAVPDPGSTLLLFGMGLAGLCAFRKRHG